MRKTLVIAGLILAGLTPALNMAAAADAQDVKVLVKALAEGDDTQRSSAEAALRKLGLDAVPALREVKAGGQEDSLPRVRKLLTEIVVRSSRIVDSDANMVHEVAREEGKGRRYVNAEMLYKRAKQLYEQLKDDADRLNDRLKKEEYRSLAELCDRMKEKANRKERNEGRGGLNIGIVHIGPEYDMSDDWE